MVKYSYNGKAKFKFDIERMLDAESGRILDMNSEEDMSDEQRYHYKVISLDVSGRAYRCEARLYGDPSVCYPEEGDCEILSAIDGDGKDWIDDLTDYEEDCIRDKIVELIIEQKYEEP